MRHFVEHSIGIVTALVPVIGYERATAVAKEALESGKGVFEVVLSRGLLTREQLDRALDPEAMLGEAGRGKREEGSGKGEAGRGKREEGSGKGEERGKREEGSGKGKHDSSTTSE